MRCLKRCVPAATPGIAFLSGGQSDIDATAHLNAMNGGLDLPWPLTFSYGRALQAAPQSAWAGKPANVAAAQRAFAHRARMNSLATRGEWKRGTGKATGVSHGCRLYLSRLRPSNRTAFAETLESALAAGDVASLQLRLKGASDDRIRAAAQALMPIAQAAGVAFIVNDRPDLAVEIGRRRRSYRTGRHALPRGARACRRHCRGRRHLPRLAPSRDRRGGAGADYVAFGAFSHTNQGSEDPLRTRPDSTGGRK